MSKLSLVSVKVLAFDFMSSRLSYNCLYMCLEMKFWTRDV